MQRAKSELIDAIRAAEDERVPAALLKQLETLAGKLETLQWKVKERAQRGNR
jgi:hypothetical protein